MHVISTRADNAVTHVRNILDNKNKHLDEEALGKGALIAMQQNSWEIVAPLAGRINFWHADVALWGAYQSEAKEKLEHLMAHRSFFPKKLLNSILLDRCKNQYRKKSMY